MAVRETEAGAAVFEIDRFEFVPNRIELVGTWSGLRARRFIRPTLVLHREGEEKRLLAMLEHKPWAADNGAEWIAVFAWDGGPEKFVSAELNVGSGLDLKLPPPRMRQGKPRRFKQRVVARDASRDEDKTQPLLASPGIVTEEIVPPEGGAEVVPAAQPADASAPAEGTAAPAEQRADTSAPPTEDPRLESLRQELDVARTERDRAREQVRALRGELEDERQAREKAVADARAAERETAGRMLAEGSELRASVERQREMAYIARDQAVAARDEAIERRDRACAERDEAFADRRQADRERDRAVADRDGANRERDRALAARDKALEERARADEERSAAFAERDTIVSIHERDLPIHQPRPRFSPPTHDRSEVEVWAPRAIAVGVLAIFTFIVLRLFAGV